MSDAAYPNSETYKRGSRPSLVESFGITGLHGYRNISLASPYSATILIAQNGSGKTTLLGALDAFLRGQFSRLRELKFDEIRCKIRGFDNEIILKRSDLLHFPDVQADSAFSKIARRYGLSPTVLFKFLMEDYEQLRDDFPGIHEEPVYAAISKVVGYRSSEVLSVLDDAKNKIFDQSSSLAEISKIMKSACKNIDIVYLPTYRRIELPLVDEPSESSLSRRRKSKFKFGSKSLFPGDIQFGLGDISDRLRELNQRILVESNRGYEQISADIVNELIDGTLERENYDSDAIPTQADLSLFFSRLKEGRRVRPYHGVTVPNIEKIYNGGQIPSESNKFLRYFLGKLNTVITATRSIEFPVEEFIDNCNKYLSFSDNSTSLTSPDRELSRSFNVDEKILRLDRRTLKVFAESVPSTRKISLEALSSGEKQMVSLFAKLFLYPREKLVLIDEPELSLSLDWQRNILADVVNAPLCRQVVAITHSPFVFDNELEPFARSLNLSINPAASPEQSEDYEAEFGE